jgi:hypothetical protein
MMRTGEYLETLYLTAETERIGVSKIPKPCPLVLLVEGIWREGKGLGSENGKK